MTVYLRSDAWRLWTDEDDLVLVIDRIVTQDGGELDVHWIDGAGIGFRWRVSVQQNIKKLFVQYVENSRSS